MEAPLLHEVRCVGAGAGAQWVLSESLPVAGAVLGSELRLNTHWYGSCPLTGYVEGKGIIRKQAQL